MRAQYRITVASTITFETECVEDRELIDDIRHSEDAATFAIDLLAAQVRRKIAKDTIVKVEEIMP